MLLDRCIGHPDVWLVGRSGRFDEIAQISPDRLLTDLVRLLATSVDESKVALQVAAVSLQCIEGQTAACLEAKPCTCVVLSCNTRSAA
jgi:hypothetical protein